MRAWLHPTANQTCPKFQPCSGSQPSCKGGALLAPVSRPRSLYMAAAACPKIHQSRAQEAASLLERAKKHGVPTPQCRCQALHPARDVRRPSSGGGGPASVAWLLPAAGAVPVPASASTGGVPRRFTGLLGFPSRPRRRGDTGRRVASPCLGAAHAAAARSYCHVGGVALRNGEGAVAGLRQAAFALQAHRACSRYPAAAAASRRAAAVA